MRASDLTERIPTVTRSTSAVDAAALIAEYRLSGLIVADDRGVPVAVVPGTQVFRLVVPRYVREDPSLAHVFDEEGAEQLCTRLRRSTVGDLLDDEEITTLELPSVLPQDTLVEIAMVMVDSRSPLVLVRDKQGRYHGAITFSRAMAAVAAAAGSDSERIQHRLSSDLLPADSPVADRPHQLADEEQDDEPDTGR
jgi:CBS domain-containing protein